MMGLGARGVGLDIGEDAVRAVLLKKKGRQFILAGVGLSEFSAPDDEQGVAQAVVAALTGAGAKKHDPLVCAILFF